jgi:hypothetical protein
MSKNKQDQYGDILRNVKKREGNLKLSQEVERLLLPPRKFGKFVPDEYDIEMCDIVKDFNYGSP